MNQKNTIRVRVKTNKFLDMMVAIEADKTVRELAHRVLHCFHELAEEHIAIPPKRRDLTVSAIKVGNFHISKQEIIGNLINDNDEIECTLSKAKPKFPNCPKAYDNTAKQMKFLGFEQHSKNLYAKQYEPVRPKNKHTQLQNSKKKDKKQAKRQKKRQKILQQQKQLARVAEKTFPIIGYNNASSNRIEDEEKDDDAYIIYRPKIASPIEEALPQPNNNQINVAEFSCSKLSNIDSQPMEQVVQFQTNPILNQTQPNLVPVTSQNLTSILPLDTTISYPPAEKKEEINMSTETKKESVPITFNKVEEVRKKKNNPPSILQILSKATQEKDKKVKRKDKRNEKAEQAVSENKLAASNSLNSSQSQKQSKNEKQFQSGNKIASPKVTFHNSPMLSPQVINLNSPKRKISNPAIQKIDLESPFDLTGSKGCKKQVQKQKKAPQKQQEEVKKQPMTTIPHKIIVEEDSQQSGQIQTTLKEEQKQSEHLNSKLAALNAKISKYKLEFFDGSEEDQ